MQVVRHDGTPLWVLVHIEVQSQRDSSFADRMLRYHVRIFDRMRQPVVSLAILGDEEPNWRPAGFSYDLWGCELAFRFPMVKLRDLDLATLEATRSPFATLTLLHRDAQATRRRRAATRRSACCARWPATAPCCARATGPKMCGRCSG